ncbi:hypothetical protein [Clostridium sp. Marseille-Q7071]
MKLQSINVFNYKEFSSPYKKSAKEKFISKDSEKLRSDIKKNLNSNTSDNEEEVISSKIITTADGMKALLLLKDLKVISTLKLGKTTNAFKQIEESEISDLNSIILEYNE